MPLHLVWLAVGFVLAANIARAKGMLVQDTVIAQPRPEIVRDLI